MKPQTLALAATTLALAAAVALASGRAAGSLAAAPGAPAPDIDLTKLKGPMVYSQLYDMTRSPRGYVGRTVRMQGAYTSFFDDESKTRWHACLVSDAMACCAQGIEFAPTNAVAWPGDFPAEGGACLVQGVFDAYEENGTTFVRLRDAVLTFRKSPAAKKP